MSVLRRVRVNAGWALLLAAPAAFADSSCDAPLVQAVRDVREVVDSLADGKPSHARAAEPGSNVAYANEARWMREQLQLIDEACRRGAEVEAAWRVEALLDSLKAHASSGPRADDRRQAAPALSDAWLVEIAARGKRTVKAEPTPSELSTSMLPPCSDSTIATRCSPTPLPATLVTLVPRK